MQKADLVKVYRVIDANLNRAKEGLRVCEDVFRFVLDDKVLTRKLKKIRHDLTEIITVSEIEKFIQFRNIERDVGKGSVSQEMNRGTVQDVLCANCQRVKESVRVLEEFTPNER